MNKVALNRNVVAEERPGWSKNCPSCYSEIRYTVLNIKPGLDLFLYCSNTSDLVLIEEDTAAFELKSHAGKLTTDDLRERYLYLENHLPGCPHDGRFKVWSNFKCPHCKHEFQYNRGRKDEKTRFYESKIVWMEGAIVYREGDTPSNFLSRVNTGDAIG
jgi:hypothetical protein